MSSKTGPPPSIVTKNGSLSKDVTLDCNSSAFSLFSVATADEAAAYPRTFVRWRAGGAGGSQIQTAVTLTLTSAVQTGTTVFYAEFT